MELEILEQLLSSDDIGGIVDKIKEASPYSSKYQDWLKEYSPENHKIFDRILRRDRELLSQYKDEQGNEQTKVTQEARNRIAFAAQKLIVARRQMFITGAGADVIANPVSDQEQRLFEMLTFSAQDNKFDFKYSSVAKHMMAEGECAVLFYMDDTEPSYWGDYAKPTTILKPKIMLRAPSLGDTFYPVYDVRRNMVAFGISYLVQVEGKDEEWFDLYTNTDKYLYRQSTGTWQLDAEGSGEHGFDRIPIAYFPCERKEWADVQWAIERFEELISNHGETVDAFGNPILLAKGKIQSFVNRKDTAKVLELEDQADAGYISWDSAPEAVKLEMETLFKIIYTVSRTPDISFESVKNVGTVSGVALRLMFLDAHAAAKEHQDGTFGESVQRMWNILKAGIVAVDQTLRSVSNLSVQVRFNTYLPQNEQEDLTNQQTLVNTLINGVQANIITRETAVKMLAQSGIDIDVEDELKKLQAQMAEQSITLEI